MIRRAFIKTHILLASFFCMLTPAQASCPECGQWKLSDRHDGRYAFVEIQKAEKNKLKAYVYLASNNDDLNQQEGNFMLTMKKNHAEYKNEATGCALFFHFKNKELTISNNNRGNNACGFDKGVSADGLYIKKK